MKRIRLPDGAVMLPEAFQKLARGCAVYDSSCSKQARVYFLDRDGGYFLKTAAAGTLAKEAQMTRFFHEKGLAAPVLEYITGDRDWLLTGRIAGEDCTYELYTSQPERLCDVTAQLLRQLHDTNPAGCPVNRTADLLAAARLGYERKTYDATLFPDNWGYASEQEAWSVLEQYGSCLKSDTLLHGDYCLPNIMLDDWRFTGFIDLDAAGAGDRHIDLFWGIWSLFFNLKTDRYRDRFLDVYGRDQVHEELLRVVAAAEVFR